MVCNPLKVSLKAGASFQVQKSRTIMMVKEMMGMSPLFAQFIAEKGLNFVLDNMEGKGVEELKALTDEWLQEYQQEKQAAQQAQNQDPAMMKAQIEAAKLEHEKQKDAQDFEIKKEKLAMEDRKLKADLILGKQSANVQIIKAMTERYAKDVDLKLKGKDMHHRHIKEAIETHHKVTHKPAEGKHAHA